MWGNTEAETMWDTAEVVQNNILSVLWIVYDFGSIEKLPTTESSANTVKSRNAPIFSTTITLFAQNTNLVE